MSAIAQTLSGIVGSEGVQVWNALDELTRTRLGRAIAPTSQMECVAYPQNEAQLADVMTWLHRHRGRSLPFGSGTKLGWGGLASEIQVGVSTARLNRLIDHAAGDLTVTAEAGMRLADLQAILSQKGQFLAIDPTYDDQATLGGIVATADAGTLRQRYGGVRDMLIGVTFVRADGKIAKAGGRVVKNVAGYDLMKLLTGSWGTLGVLSQLTFRVYPLPEASGTVVLTGKAEAIAQATQTLLSSALTPTAVELLAATTVQTLELGDGLGLICRFQSLAVGVQQQVAQMLAVGQTLGLGVDSLDGEPETLLWKRLREMWEAPARQPLITCKIGVLPAQAVMFLDQLHQIIPQLELGQIHAGSGLGMLRFGSEAITADQLRQLRQRCQAQGGFLSILEAPTPLKQLLDVWGYSGNALALMKGIKQQFDPQNLLSPDRFLQDL